MTATTFNPPSMIPAFNAWGNHPGDMVVYIRTHVSSAFQRLGISEKYPEAEKILIDALQVLAKQPKKFTGYYQPCKITQRVLTDFLMANFIQPKKCHLFGKENYKKALELTNQGKNVLIVQNHTSPLDTLVPFTLISQEFPGTKLPAIIISQVFEYCRITGIITSSVEKYPVFQPKHMRKFAGQDQSTVLEMKRQNSLSLTCLSRNANKGGKMIFLYPERDRNSFVMGAPEPKSMRIVELLSDVGPDLYIMPTFITGLQSIFPNRPGINELDAFFELIQVGQGDFYCGEPTSFLKIKNELGQMDKHLIINQCLGNTPDSQDEVDTTALAVILLKMIADLAPNESMKGIYA